MKKLIKRILIYLIILIIFSIIYFLSFRLPLDKIITVFTYKGIFLLFIISLILLITLIILKKIILKDMSIKDIIIILLLFTSVHLYIFCMVPVTIERAYSVFMLNEITKLDNQTITLEYTEKLFIENYVRNNEALQKRFNEQIVTGTITEVSPNTYKLTNKGNFIVSLFHFFNKLYNVNSNLLK